MGTLGEIKIPIRYGSDLERAESILRQADDEVVGDYARHAAMSWAQVSKKYVVEKAQTGPVITLVANDNWYEYTIRYTVAYSRCRSTRHMLFRDIVAAVGASENAVKLASATYELVGVPPIDVRVDVQNTKDTP